MNADPREAEGQLETGGRRYRIASLERTGADLDRLPFSIKVLLENLLRHQDGANVTGDDVDAVARWRPSVVGDREITFAPARILMQDFTGVPAVVDLAAMRDAMAGLGGDPTTLGPLVPAELVIDHSVVADVFGVPEAFSRNAEIEFERNRERYSFLRWGQTAFQGLRVVPPNTGICHQVNLEYLARVVFTDGDGWAYPDTLVGTDSHTPMVNGLGVLGWGVGGIEAEAALLGQPLPMLVPQVVGFELTGELPEGATATDLVLTITQLLRAHGVVGKFVEFHGAGVGRLPLANRATIGNMSPEYGSTCSIFPIDGETLRYLTFTGRPPDLVALVEAYAKQQGLWHDERSPVADYSEHLELDLSTVEPSLAGPTRPQDRVLLRRAKQDLATALELMVGEPSSTRGQPPVLPFGVTTTTQDDASSQSFPASDPPSAAAGATRQRGGGAHDDVAEALEGLVAFQAQAQEQERLRPSRPVPVRLADGTDVEIDHGHVVIAAITSCTNTSNPSVMVAAGLLARKAVERGLLRKPWVKTTLAPGSTVVMDYLERAGLVAPLEKLGFYLVGFGCTTCIGNSGPLLPEVSAAVEQGDLAVASVLSGNRNFEGRINPDCRLNYLASPPLVVAYAIVGTMDFDPYTEPLGTDAHGAAVHLRDIWPTSTEVAAVVDGAVRSEMFMANYARVFEGDARWNDLSVPSGGRYAWQDRSTYIRRPPFLEGLSIDPAPLEDVRAARALAVLGDSVTTDHISPAGVIRPGSPAGRWLEEQGVSPSDFNSYGSRRGNHEVMVRGTFANIRLRNRLAPGTEGGVTRHLPDGEELTIYEAAMRYAVEGTPLLVLAGKEYGSGSSRDWAAKGTALLGVRAVVAESYERIHRSNLVGMGVLPLQFLPGESVASLGLTGEELFDIEGLAQLAADGPLPDELTVRADERSFAVHLRVDTPKEAEYLRHGGILPYVLRHLRQRALPSPQP